jgi:hypothetical protein
MVNECDNVDVVTRERECERLSVYIYMCVGVRGKKERCSGEKERDIYCVHERERLRSVCVCVGVCGCVWVCVKDSVCV